MNLSDVGVIEPGEYLRLALETRHAFGVSRDRLGEDFDGDGSFQVGVRGAIDLPHAPFADEHFDFVGADACPRTNCHG
jgi:hypothetical protein